jgi:hypothetical protein
MLDVDAGTVWEILAGRMLWSFALPDGRASAESLAAEGDAVHVDHEAADAVRELRGDAALLVGEHPIGDLGGGHGVVRGGEDNPSAGDRRLGAYRCSGRSGSTSWSPRPRCDRA